jgi:hypothetical protein
MPINDGVVGNLLISRLSERVNELEEIGPRFKNNNQVANNTTTFTEVTDLSYRMNAYENISFRYIIFYSGDATADCKFTVTAPTGAELRYAPSGSVAISDANALTRTEGVSAEGTAFVFGTTSSSLTNFNVAEIVGIVKNGDNSGNLTLLFAQNTQTVANTNVLRDSHLFVYQAYPTREP